MTDKEIIAQLEDRINIMQKGIDLAIRNVDEIRQCTSEGWLNICARKALAILERAYSGIKVDT